MALTKETKVEKIEVVGEYKAVQIATDTIVKEDNVELSRSRSRRVLHPNDDISGESTEIKNVCNAVWTDDVKSAWTAFNS
jgi:hypothetical protein|tara:strand:+ start:492 stop:731 length:240 start_codon:yes stop_codon:yes gene_type:complete